MSDVHQVEASVTVDDAPSLTPRSFQPPEDVVERQHLAECHGLFPADPYCRANRERDSDPEAASVSKGVLGAYRADRARVGPLSDECPRCETVSVTVAAPRRELMRAAHRWATQMPVG